MGRDGLQVLMRYLTLYGQVVDRRAPAKDHVNPTLVNEESAHLLKLATTWSTDPDNEQLRTAVLRSALKLAHLKDEA
jgi:hypothetical protein